MAADYVVMHISNSLFYFFYKKSGYIINILVSYPLGTWQTCAIEIQRFLSILFTLLNLCIFLII